MMQRLQDNSCCSIQMLVDRPLMKEQEQNPEGISAVIITQREVGVVFKGHTCF